MKLVVGNLISLAKVGEFDAIMHGCNCFCTMGAGIAKTIKQVFPEAYLADLETVKGDKAKLGTYSVAPIHRGSVSFVIINAYTQFDWRGQGTKADYAAIRPVFSKLGKDFSGKRIGYPLIGAGLAGGDWSLISAIIDEELAEMDHTLVRFEGR